MSHILVWASTFSSSSGRQIRVVLLNNKAIRSWSTWLRGIVRNHSGTSRGHTYKQFCNVPNNQIIGSLETNLIAYMISDAINSIQHDSKTITLTNWNMKDTSNVKSLPWKHSTRKKRTVKRKARTLLVDDDDDEFEDAFAAFIFFKALILSIRTRFIIASSAISLISFWSAASKDIPLGGLGGFLALPDLRLSFTFFFSTPFSATNPLTLWSTSTFTFSGESSSSSFTSLIIQNPFSGLISCSSSQILLKNLFPTLSMELVWVVATSSMVLLHISTSITKSQGVWSMRTPLCNLPRILIWRKILSNNPSVYKTELSISSPYFHKTHKMPLKLCQINNSNWFSKQLYIMNGSILLFQIKLFIFWWYLRVFDAKVSQFQINKVISLFIFIFENEIIKYTWKIIRERRTA